MSFLSPRVVAWTAWSVLWTACAGGTEETATVQVRVERGEVAAGIWRLRARVLLPDGEGEQWIPTDPPAAPLAFPGGFTLTAGHHGGTLEVHLQALGADAGVLGEASGRVELVPGAQVPLDLSLRRGCARPADCADGVFCNGPEDCVQGRCVPGVPPCVARVACVLATCDETTQGCTQEAQDARCPGPGWTCSAVHGCVWGGADGGRR